MSVVCACVGVYQDSFGGKNVNSNRTTSTVIFQKNVMDNSSHFCSNISNKRCKGPQKYLFFYHLFCATEVKALSAQINLIEQKVIHGEGDIHELTHILCSTEV